MIMANTKSNTKKTTTKETISKKDYEDMQKHMKEMEEMIKNLTANSQPSNIQYITNVNENNKDVTLTSLTVGELNLSTEGYGQGLFILFIIMEKNKQYHMMI